MNYIFYFLIVISIIAGAINGKLPDVVNSILTGAELSVKVAFSLIGIMAFWLGMMKIAEKCGLISIIAKIIKPITKRLFNEIPENSPAIGDIAMSFSANAFGLTNAATPIGIKAHGIVTVIIWFTISIHDCIKNFCLFDFFKFGCFSCIRIEILS